MTAPTRTSYDHGPGPGAATAPLWPAVTVEQPFPWLSEASEDEVTKILKDVRYRFGMDVALVSHFADGRRVIDVIDAGFPVPLDRGHSDGVEDTYCQRIVDGRLPEAVGDTSATPVAREIPATAQLGIKSHLGVPIVLADGHVYGTLCAYAQERKPDLDDRSATMLGLVADAIARAVASDHEAWQAREAVRQRIGKLIADRLLAMAYQPLVDISTGKVVAVEALARFPPGTGGAAEWFAEAVSVGEGATLERAALQMVAEDVHLVPPDVDVHVNVSPSALLKARTTALLARLPLHRLVLELTEHEIVDDYLALAKALAPLREAGVRVAVDDAGAGFASFRHALLLKPDVLKLDISLVRDIDRDPAKRSLCKALTGFAHATGAQIVAEGVETEAEAAAVRALGVDLGQGYLFARPSALAEVLWQVGPNLPPQRISGVHGATGTVAAPAPRGEHSRETSLAVAVLVSEGASAATIAAALNQRGLLTPSGRRWHRTSVSRLLLS